MIKQKTKAGFDLKPFLIIIGFMLIPLIIFIFYRISTSTNRLIPISAIALIAGAIIESKILSQKWSTVLYSALFSFVLSFLWFLPGKHETIYIFENHIVGWPYGFLFIFVILTVAFNKDKLIPKLSEGITLLMSIAIVYWIIDHGFYNTSSAFLKTIMIIGFIIAGFSIINSFVNIPLTKSFRLFLSLWSSIIMALLAIDNIYNIYQNGQIEDSIFFLDKLLIGLQYFLLGVCSIYIAQNIMMIIGFLPDKNRFFNKEYYKDLKVLTNDHVNRYSDKQSNLILSSICLIIASLFFMLNFNYDLMPRNTAIWLVFFLLNRIVYFYNTKEIKTTANTRS